MFNVCGKTSGWVGGFVFDLKLGHFLYLYEGISPLKLEEGNLTKGDSFLHSLNSVSS